MDDGSAEAWRQGYEAGCVERAASANPYATGSEPALDWDDGWREGVHPRNRPAYGDADGDGGWPADGDPSGFPAWPRS